MAEAGLTLSPYHPDADDEDDRQQDPDQPGEVVHIPPGRLCHHLDVVEGTQQDIEASRALKGIGTVRHRCDAGNTNGGAHRNLLHGRQLETQIFVDMPVKNREKMASGGKQILILVLFPAFLDQLAFSRNQVERIRA